MHQVGVDAVPPGGRVDDVGERPLGRLGREREEAGAGADEQQEHETTAGEARRRHGERAPYHIEGPSSPFADESCSMEASRPAMNLMPLGIESGQRNVAGQERIDAAGCSARQVNGVGWGGPVSLPVAAAPVVTRTWESTIMSRGLSHPAMCVPAVGATP